LNPPSPFRLPAEYKQLESRVDALRDVHQKLLKITKVHETESVSQQCLSLRSLRMYQA
jgi:hypothetical protein